MGLLLACASSQRCWPQNNVPEEIPPPTNPTAQDDSTPDQTPQKSTSVNFWPAPGLEVLKRAVGAVSEIETPNAESEHESAAAGEPPRQHRVPLGTSVPNDVVVNEDDGLISLVVRDAPLRQVIALVAETQKLNIVFASPVEVPVTASFDKVPWQQAIEALLSISGHTWTVSEGIIFVTSIDAADFVSPRAGGRIVQVFELDYGSAVDVDQTVKGLLSPAGKSWLVESSTDDNRRTREAIAVVDYPANIDRISDYICQVDQPPRQVLIEANILQIELSEDCRNGINFDTLARFHGNELGLQTVGFANSTASTAFFLDVTGHALDGLVELLQSTTDAKTLASPKVMTVSGQQSHIQIGSQLGFRVTTTTQTSTLESIQFLDVGVVLTVTPRITRDGRVLMRIKPKVSTGAVDPDTGLPSEDTTEVETDILLNNGQGMVIGGLIQELDSNTQTKIPWFGDLPYVGILFTRRQVEKSRSEIVVTLVPHIFPYTPNVENHEAQQLARSQDRLLHGPLYRNPRPYEARLPDTFTNPRRPVRNLAAIHRAKISGDYNAQPAGVYMPDSVDVYIPEPAGSDFIGPAGGDVPESTDDCPPVPLPPVQDDFYYDSLPTDPESPEISFPY